MYKPVENRFDGISDEHITSRDPDRWFRFRQRFYTLNGMIYHIDNKQCRLKHQPEHST